MLTDEMNAKLQEHYLSAFPGFLDEMEAQALQLEKDGFNEENYFALYRQAHSLKGSGGTYGFPIISTLCHQFEDFLTPLKESGSLSAEQADKILAYIDLLHMTYEGIASGSTDFNRVEKELKQLLSDGTSTTVLKGIIVDNSCINMNIIAKALEGNNIVLTHTRDGMQALQRLLHEKFDFLITSNLNDSLNGPALIAATRLGSDINKNIASILITSDKKPQAYKSEPDAVVMKDRHFLQSVTEFVNGLNKH